MIYKNPNAIDQAIILCGGRGTRLRNLTNDLIHKSVIKIGDYPFLYYLFNQLEKIGIKKIILCTGYLSETIERHVEIFKKNNPNIFQFIISKENKQLGTAGALFKINKFLTGNKSLIINGDTFYCGDLNLFLKESNNSEFTILSSKVFLSNSYGKIIFKKNNFLLDFDEKKFIFFGNVFSGYSIISNKFLINKNYDNQKINIEDYFFKNKKLDIKVCKSNKKFIDIGTNKRFFKYNNFFSYLKLPYHL